MERLKGAHLLFYRWLCRLHHPLLDWIRRKLPPHCTGSVFFGAVFVLFVGTLALQTAAEIKRTSALQHENITDHLIGINNRRYLDKKLVEEIARAQRYKLPLSLIILDIDHFKKINDTYGHPVGDSVLKGLGKLLFKKVRDTDVIARYGGEEIAVLAIQTSLASAVDFAERLRFAIATSPIVPEEKGRREAISITVSIGVAGLDREVQDGSDFIKGADKALYDAKQAGRNKVVAFVPQGVAV